MGILSPDMLQRPLVSPQKPIEGTGTLPLWAGTRGASRELPLQYRRQACERDPETPYTVTPTVKRDQKAHKMRSQEKHEAVTIQGQGSRGRTDSLFPSFREGCCHHTSEQALTAAQSQWPAVCGHASEGTGLGLMVKGQMRWGHQGSLATTQEH